MKVNKYLSEKGFLFLLVLGAALYFQHAWVQGFFLDGYLYSAFAKHAAEKGDWLIPHLSQTTYSQFPVHPPFVFSLNGLFFKIFGASYTTARIFSGLFSLICLIGVIRLVQKYDSEDKAFLSGLIFILIPPLIKKTRFPSLDGPLMLFVFMSLFFYFDAFKKNKKHSWVLTGLFFGLALLTKGPMAGLIPLAIIMHLLFAKKISLLKQVTPWLSLLLGFIIFSIWPLLLLIKGRADVLDLYIESTFFHTMLDGRGVTKFNYFDYLIFLLKQTGPWLLLSFYSLYKLKKGYKNDLLLFSCTTFFSLLIFLSIPKFKYSNYLLPLYPFYAIVAANALAFFLSDSRVEKIKKGVLYLFVATSMALLVFPLTVGIRRDKPIFEILKMTKGLEKKPNLWLTIDGAYPFYSLANLIGFELSGEVVNTSMSWLKGFSNGAQPMEFDTERPVNWGEMEPVVLLRKKDFQEFEVLLSKKFKSIGYFKKEDIVVLVRIENISSLGLKY